MFDPRYPDTSNSLNRVVIADLPGLDLPDDVKGQTGYGLVSSFALDKLIEANIQALGLHSYSGAADYNFFEVMFNRDDPIAVKIAETLGRNLGYLLLTLIRGHEVNRNARAEWSDVHWELWGNIKHIHLGGGMVSDEFGEIMLEQAQMILDMGQVSVSVDITPYPHILPILGAARYIPSGSTGLVFDFGGTRIKACVAHFEDNSLAKIQQLPIKPVQLSSDVSPKVVRAKIRDAVAEVSEHHEFDASIIPLSIAGYVDAKGHPIMAQGGIYMTLAKLSDDVPAMLSDVVSKRIGKAVEIKLLHDGSAAASFYAPEDNAAVIMIGTALGSGYCVPRPELRPVSPNLSISDAHAG